MKKVFNIFTKEVFKILCPESSFDKLRMTFEPCLTMPDVILSLSKDDSGKRILNTFLKNLKTSLLLLFLLISPAYALSPEARLSDEVLEQRAMKLFLEVRCLVCAGQVIESSDTEFSFEMRKLIRKEIADKKTDQEIKDKLVKDFGPDILVEPSLKGSFLLWILPAIFAIFAIMIYLKFISLKKGRSES